MVPRELFYAAQKRLEENLQLAQRNAKREYLLSGLVRHVCGSAMGGRTRGSVTYYYCYKSRDFAASVNERGEPQPCHYRQINGKALEAAVWDTVTDLLRHPDLLVDELENLGQPDSATREAMEEELAHVNSRLEELPKEERRLVEGYRKGSTPTS
ncbi:MAG: zinc ribbon domain-containing protein [Dehalococcoidia bacterium]|jgi:hypothetical protein|nr:zinc ribbon domain-containing protein [Dehalococcoidia bacterium]